jgi:hypothetical protein
MIFKQPINWLTLFSLIFSAGFTIWTLSFYFGTELFLLIFFPWIIMPVCLGFSITLLMTFISWLFDDNFKNKILLYSHGITLAIILVTVLYFSELLKSEHVLEAQLNDDLSRIDLVLRKNGRFEVTSSGMFGVSETIKGDYKINNDTLIFSRNPYLNDFLPKKVLLDKAQKRIFFRKGSNGQFLREDSFAGYFSITLNTLWSN